MARFGISRQWVCPEVIVFKGMCRSDALSRVACEQPVNEITSFRAESHDKIVSLMDQLHL
jgi:hypothetical protein